ncbi:MAG: putative methyltransferase [Chthoniobacteraceae bacterium]|nr:putative methyltransferase [Chthoniobacteraceae bacterium]
MSLLIHPKCPRLRRPGRCACPEAYAIDASDAVLGIARAKAITPDKVEFALGDAWDPPKLEGGFTACLAAFFVSHIEKHRLPAFLAAIHTALAPGARVVLADNRFVPGNSTPISRTDAAGNTYQLRHLDDGRTFEVLKNFPKRAELSALVRPYADSISMEESEYFWCLNYKLRDSAIPQSNK